MTPAAMDRVFGADRLQVATGEHVEVFREAVQHGIERRYTKRFLAGASGDFRAWTEREWQVLERLDRHRAPVARPLDLLPADDSGSVRLQTRDAGATVEQWATLVPLRRDERALRNVFEDCAHWWSLAHRCLLALDAVHALGFVHLELKPDNVCIPWAPAGAGRLLPGQPLRPRFRGLTLIDVAFSLLPEVDFVAPLPLLRQPAYAYQSPRLLHALEEGRRGDLGATRALDWRCDFFSLAAMLLRYLPGLDQLPAAGWTTGQHLQASAFVQRLVDLHGASVPAHWPHRELVALAAERLRDPELAAALAAGCSFDPERTKPLALPTPPTRLAEAAPVPVDASPEEAPVDTEPTPLDEPANGTSQAPAPPPSERAPTRPAEPEPRAPRVSQVQRAAARRRRALRGFFGLVLIGAAAAWWFSREQPGRSEMPSLSDLADRSLPAAARRGFGASEPAPARADAAPAANDELAAQAETWRRERLPGIAVAAERRLARVLTTAAGSAEFRRRGNVRAEVRTMRAAATPAPTPGPARAERVRSLNDAALAAYVRSNDVGEAIALQTQALGANPLDSEVAGNLAFLLLKERRPTAEAARRLALHALTLNDLRFPSGRNEDWTTLAIASALTGHDNDARNAWFVALALTDDLQHLCNAAVSARTRHGERLRPSVQALMQRARSAAAYGRCEVAATEPTSRGKGQAKPTPKPGRTIP